METRRKKNMLLVGKWLCYSLLLVLAAVLQTLPGFLTIAGARPLFILPLCMAVSIYEGEFRGALFGAVGGLLWDLTAGRVAGLLAIQLLVVCFMTSVLVQLFLRVNHMNFILLCAAAVALVTGVDFLFNYLMRGYSRGAWYYGTVILPIVIFTSAAAPLSFLVVRWVFERFTRTE